MKPLNDRTDGAERISSVTLAFNDLSQTCESLATRSGTTRTTKKTSRNSSKPSSQTGKDETALKNIKFQF